MVMEYMNYATYLQEKIDLVRDSSRFKFNLDQNLNPVKNENKMKSYMSDALEGLIYLHSKGEFCSQGSSQLSQELLMEILNQKICL